MKSLTPSVLAFGAFVFSFYCFTLYAEKKHREYHQQQKEKQNKI